MDGDLHILQHALGLDQYGRGREYRNRFVTGPGTTDYPACVRLTEQGLMIRRVGNELTGGDDCFFVTDAGRAYVRKVSPAPPKLTRDQKRYRDFLAADSGMTFIEWLQRFTEEPNRS